MIFYYGTPITFIGPLLCLRLVLLNGHKSSVYSEIYLYSDNEIPFYTGVV